MFSSTLFKYSSTRLILKVAINYRVAQNKLVPGSLFKFVRSKERKNYNNEFIRKVA